MKSDPSGRPSNRPIWDLHFPSASSSKGWSDTSRSAIKLEPPLQLWLNKSSINSSQMMKMMMMMMKMMMMMMMMMMMITTLRWRRQRWTTTTTMNDDSGIKSLLHMRAIQVWWAVRLVHIVSFYILCKTNQCCLHVAAICMCSMCSYVFMNKSILKSLFFF